MEHQTGNKIGTQVFTIHHESLDFGTVTVNLYMHIDSWIADA